MQSDIAPDLTDKGLFSFWSRDTLRWGDQDSMGHINNVQFARYCETGRIAFLEAATNGRSDAENFLLARLTVNFRAQARYPGTIDIGTRVLHIGRSSIRFGQGLFVAEACVATSDAVIVMVDGGERRPCPVPGPLRARLLSMNS